MQIMILEDDRALCDGMRLALSAEERTFLLCHTIKEAKAALAENQPNLLILDIQLPDGSGLDLCAKLRQDGFTVPILMLTAKDTELDMVAGLEQGADDYVTKPFSLAVLRARVSALLRRGGLDSGNLAPEGFAFDFESMRFSKDGKPIELSKTEARLLKLLFSNKGQTLTRAQLCALLWPDGTAYVDENALSVAIRRLRAKLETDPSNPNRIKTVHGIGYKWAVRT